MLLRATAILRLLGLTRIPVLFLCSPVVEQLDEKGCAVRIPLRRLTKNHVGSMYLAVLVAGADCAAGLNVLWEVSRKKLKVVPVFKDVRASFLKRADGDVVFRCDQGEAILAAVHEADRTGERITMPVKVIATVPSKYGDEPVAEFTMGLSMKKKDAL